MERTLDLTGQSRLQCTQARVIHLNEETRQVRHVISTSRLDRNNRVVELTGWKLTNFRANPLVFADHEYDLGKVIGRAIDTKVEGDSLVSTTEFAEDGLANVAFRLVQQGYVRAWSVGWRGVKAHYSDEAEGECPCKEIAKKAGTPYVLHFQQQELLEYSLVTIPANPDAVMSLQAAGLVRSAEADEWIGTCRAASETTVDTAASTDAVQVEPLRFSAAALDRLLGASRRAESICRELEGSVASCERVIAALRSSERVRGISRQ